MSHRLEADLKQQIAQGLGFLSLCQVVDLPVELPFEELSFELFRGALALGSVDQEAFFFQKTIEKDGCLILSETCMGFDPFEKLSVSGHEVRIHTLSENSSLSGNPFQLLQVRLNKYRMKPYSELPSSQVGAMGFIGYDSVRFVEPKLVGHKGAFEFIESQSVGRVCDAELILCSKYMVIDHLRKRLCFVCGAPQVEKNEINIPETARTLAKNIECFKILYFECLRRINKSKASKGEACAPNDELNPELMSSSLGRETFLKGVEKLKSHIVAGDIFQAVLSNRFETPLKVEPLHIFETLLKTHRSAYQFYFQSAGRILLGASPEMLVKVSGQDLESHPIAGTRPRGSTPGEEKRLERQLLNSPKEKAEHLMLVDLARNDLGRIAVAGSVKVPVQMKLKKFPTIMHLVSKVTATLKREYSPLDALSSCFPAGTLSGAPKVRAMQLISEIEGKPRGVYGGAVGLFGFNGDIDTCIAIRCLEIIDSQIAIQAGAGIVADSNPQREYEEILHKTKMLRRVVAHAERIFGPSTKRQIG